MACSEVGALGGRRRNSALNWRRRRTLVVQPSRETNGETAVRAGTRLEPELSTDVSLWEDLVATFGQGCPN